jgi:PAS domain S-box-containing protein
MATESRTETFHASPEWTAFFLKLSDALRPLTDVERIQQQAERLLCEQLRTASVRYTDVVHQQVDRFCLDVFERGETLAIADVSRDPRVSATARSAFAAAGVVSYLGTGRAKNGQLIATLVATDVAPRGWTRVDVAMLEETARRTSDAVQQARTEAALRESEERHAFLLRLNDALRPLSDPTDMQEIAARLVGEHLRVNRVGYAEIQGNESVIRREYVHGVTPLVGPTPANTFGAALMEAYERGDTVIVHDVRTDPRFTDAERVNLAARQIAAFIGAMLIKDGRLVAAFGANNATPRVWTRTEIALILDVAERTWEATERARAETALREREQRLRLALDASSGGSWTWDARTNHVDWDEHFRARYGFSPDEPPSFEAWLGRVHEEDRQRVLSLLDQIQCTSSMDAWDNTFRIVRPDGAVLWIQSLGRADRGSTGAVTRLTGLEFDVTERHVLEEARQARRDEERDRELRLLLETATQGIVSVDDRGTVVMANHALEAMFGWDHGELLGQSIDRLIPSLFRDRLEQRRREHLVAPRARAGTLDLDHVGYRKDGTTFPIEVSLNHIATPGGGHAIAFVTDITARKQAEFALGDRTIELEHRTAQLSRLASDLTLAEQHAREQLAKTLHDGLQQLLVGAAMNLERRAQRDEQQGAPLDDTLVQARTHLDEAIAAARHLSFELFPPALHGSGLPAALAWLADRTRTQYGLSVDVSLDPLANSDRKDVRTLLFESVRELLFNAVKHARVDRVSVDLALNPDDTLSIIVADQGIGFEPARLIDRAKAGDVGWGLFSIRERLTLLGGRFDIDSRPGGGTTFRLIAPRRNVPHDAAAFAPSADAAPRQDSSDTAVDVPAGARALRILIADDHPLVRRAFRQLLQRAEFAVVGEAATGLEAVAEANVLRPDVVLMDVSMPDMDGVEATRRLRAALPSVEILGLSTQPRPAERHAIEHAGASAFFTKGVDTQRLIDRLLAIHSDRTTRHSRSPVRHRSSRVGREDG